jgi:hypothetical protein
MKKYLYSIVFATLILMSTTVVKASNEVYYTNRENIEMTENEYNNLLGLGFTEKQIYRMDQGTFLENKDIEGTVLSEEGKYIKRTTFMRNGVKTYQIEEITKEEAENEKRLQSQNPPFRGGPAGNYYDGVSETTILFIKAKIIGLTSTYMRLMTLMEWYTMPSVNERYNDIIAIGFESSKVQRISTIVFREDWEDGYGEFGYNTVCAPKTETNGGSAIFTLPDGSLEQLEAYIYFNIAKQDNVGTITELYTSGDYAHALNLVYPSDLLSHYYVTSAYGITIDATYDNDYIIYPPAYASYIGSW